MTLKETESTTYVLGTDQDELDRLHRQHIVWRELTLNIWKKAGVTAGSRVVDLGAGPGFASLDLAHLVGPSGKVYALERSLNFSSHLSKQIKDQKLAQVEVINCDLEQDSLPLKDIDVVWCRWVCIFLKDPMALIAKLKGILKPGGRIIFFEYYDYATWTMYPHSPLVDRFVQRVIKSWKETGSNSNVAPILLEGLLEHGFHVETAQPHFHSCHPGAPKFQWLTDYMKVNTSRIVKQGVISNEEASDFINLISKAENSGNFIMMTPTIMEIIAKKG
ncbi:MAG: methyltransferase domain-containing protein [Proteobacteria bacterium]|nr:methyltransferase domain-containing protein [Pseudomonadota bacterium]